MAKFVKANDKDVGTLAELIDDVTSNNSENSKALLTIYEIINNSSEGPKEAVKCFKKRLSTKNPSVVRNTVSLLDSCIKNCGLRFQSQIFNKEFLQSFLKVIKPKNNPTPEVQKSVLAAIQRWAISFQGVPELREICRTYEDMMNSNIEFPARDPDQISELYIMETMQPEVCTVYEVEPSSATLCAAGSARPRGKSAEPQFPHRNTLNPSGRSASRDRSPGPGGMRRASYITADGDPRGGRKLSYIVVANDATGGGGERKQSYVGGERKLSYFANADGQIPVIIHGKDRKPSYIGTMDAQGPGARKASCLGVGGGERKASYVVASDLRSELDSIRQNCQSFREMLSTVKPGKELPSDKELLREYNLTCLEMKKRVVKLMESPEGEKHSDELLSLNDELNGVLFQYQKHNRSATSAEKDSLAPPGAQMTHQPVTITVEDSDASTLIDLNGSSKKGGSNVRFNDGKAED